MIRCIFSGVSPEVYTASFGGDVKPSVPGCWSVLAFSCYFQLATLLATLVYLLVSSPIIQASLPPSHHSGCAVYVYLSIYVRLNQRSIKYVHKFANAAHALTNGEPEYSCVCVVLQGVVRHICITFRSVCIWDQNGGADRWIKMTFEWLIQEVVTDPSPVEALATRIKMKSSDQCSFLEPVNRSRRILSD